MARLILSVRSLVAFISAVTILLMARSICRWPPLHALRLTLALPASVTGPVERVHGCHVLIASACRCRLSKLHPFAITYLHQ